MYKNDLWRLDSEFQKIEKRIKKIEKVIQNDNVCICNI